ncbi:PilX N-terminal domain-containing pilus assembly protein [Lysobacter koreensis]|uniref:PilX N-terminal domain-containing pilus assembly protein n=1 Tax=Lysobacter koreensis TaxID=266122 RepID=A0ABW2YM29_9GAMM
MTRRTLPQFDSRRGQRGAVLYVALIMLLLLAMIGIVGMQVTGMQERMSSNYRSANLAFQNAEGDARRVECFIEATVNRTATACPAVTIDTCSEAFDASAWAQTHAFATPAADRVSVRAIGPCISGNTSLGMGGELDEDPNPIYQITVYATDLPVASGADAAIDTIFRP